MSWFGSEINGPLVLTRAIHFAASATAAGAVMFRAFVAEPALHTSPDGYAIVRGRIAALTWTGLAIAAVTGLAWLLLQTMSMTGLPFGDAMKSGTILTVVNETQFGLVSEVRAALAVVLTACLVLNRFCPVALACARSRVGAGRGDRVDRARRVDARGLGDLHLTADVLHLWAAAAWIGGLLGLSILFAVGRRRSALEWGPLLNAVLRFSTHGMISVAVLMLSGIVNAWILVGSFHALLVTDYGQLLLLKIVTFVAMVAFAAVNRFWLTPRLALVSRAETQRAALSALTRNTLVESVLALAIFAIVGVLGTLHPGIHLVQ